MRPIAEGGPLRAEFQTSLWPLSNFLSTLVVGAAGVGLAAGAASVAAGEFAAGPEAWPLAALTLIFAGVAAAVGAATGASQDRDERDTLHARSALAAALATHEFDVDLAKASLSSGERKHLSDDYVQSVRDVMEGNEQASDDAKPSREHEIAQQYIRAKLEARVKDVDFVDPLTSSERDYLHKHLSKHWEEVLDTYAVLQYDHAVLQTTRLNQLQTRILSRIEVGEKVTLTDDERRLLANDPEFGHRVAIASAVMQQEMPRAKAELDHLIASGHSIGTDYRAALTRQMKADINLDTSIAATTATELLV